MQKKHDPGLGYAFTTALLFTSGLLVVLLLLPPVVDVVHGRWFAIAGAPLPALGMLFLFRHALLVVTALALAIFVFALWQRKTWGFLGINVVAAIALALVIVQVTVLGHHRASIYLILLVLCAGAVLILANTPVLRSHVGARPINQLVEALKWVAAAIIVLASVGLVSAMTVSGASARLRLQPYQALASKYRIARTGGCQWTTQPRVCLPTSYLLRPSEGATIVERGSSGTATMAISENAWDMLAAGLGFDSGYELQTVIWGSTYIPLVYATLKQAMYTEGMSVYRLHGDKVRALIQVQPQSHTWQVSATVYLPDASSFELISAHRDKGTALHPVLVALDAY